MLLFGSPRTWMIRLFFRSISVFFQYRKSVRLIHEVNRSIWFLFRSFQFRFSIIKLWFVDMFLFVTSFTFGGFLNFTGFFVNKKYK
jgi:hypothetical protein